MSTSEMSAEQVRKIAALARVSLREDEIAPMAQQLGAIVEYMRQLERVPTDGVEPLVYAVPLSNVFREDEPTASLPVAQALANAPAKRLLRGESYFAVPAVLE